MRADVAMTGEITLTGQVLPIGGLKEKALAAQRNGIHTVIAPELNEPDVDEIPEHLRRTLRFVFVGDDRRGAGGRAGSPARPKGVSRILTRLTRPSGPEGDQWHHEEESRKAVPFNAADLASITKANPYVQRLIEDAELRDNVRTALDSRKSAYDRLTSGKAPHEGAPRRQEAPEATSHGRRGAPRRGHGASPRRPSAKRQEARRLRPQAAARWSSAAPWRWPLSENLRYKVLDALFGAEEEFEYTPPPGRAGAPAGQHRSPPPSARATTAARARGRPQRAPSSFAGLPGRDAD